MSLSSAAVALTAALPLPGLLPQPLLAHRSAEQSTWLVEMAMQARGNGSTRVCVVTESDQPAVVAYDACCIRLPICKLKQQRWIGAQPLRRQPARYVRRACLLSQVQTAIGYQPLPPGLVWQRVPG